MSDQKMTPMSYTYGCLFFLLLGVIVGHIFTSSGSGEGHQNQPQEVAGNGPKSPTTIATSRTSKTFILAEPCPAANGDVYVADDDGGLWALRGIEASPVRIVSSFSNPPASPTTQSVQRALTNAEISRQVNDAKDGFQSDTSN